MPRRPRKRQKVAADGTPSAKVPRQQCSNNGAGPSAIPPMGGGFFGQAYGLQQGFAPHQALVPLYGAAQFGYFPLQGYGPQPGYIPQQAFVVQQGFPSNEAYAAAAMAAFSHPMSPGFEGTQVSPMVTSSTEEAHRIGEEGYNVPRASASFGQASGYEERQYSAPFPSTSRSLEQFDSAMVQPMPDGAVALETMRLEPRFFDSEDPFWTVYSPEMEPIPAGDMYLHDIWMARGPRPPPPPPPPTPQGCQLPGSFHSFAEPNPMVESFQRLDGVEAIEEDE